MKMKRPSVWVCVRQLFTGELKKNVIYSNWCECDSQHNNNTDHNRNEWEWNCGGGTWKDRWLPNKRNQTLAFCSIFLFVNVSSHYIPLPHRQKVKLSFRLRSDAIAFRFWFCRHKWTSDRWHLCAFDKLNFAPPQKLTNTKMAGIELRV